MQMRIVFLLIFFSFLLSCGTPSGEFAFKTSYEKGYRKVTSSLEFDSNGEVQWIYSFNKMRGRLDCGVVILKRELFWVDVLSYPDYVDAEKRIIYGTISGFEPGDYRLIITKAGVGGHEIIDEIGFYLYSDDDSLF